MLYPMMVIAAISVILFSIVGIGTMTGYIPSALSQKDETVISARDNDAVTREAELKAQAELQAKASAQAPEAEALAAKATAAKAAPGRDRSRGG